MKPQNRSFVVEYKSGRRRPLAEQTSIWGKTDIKALVQKVQADAPHLFGRSDEACNTNPVVLEEVEVSADPSADASAKPIHRLEPQTQLAVASATLIAAAQYEARATTSVRQVSKQKPRRAKAVQHKHKLTVGSAADQRQPLDDDDLASLERDNLRLKGQWRKKLLDENQTLSLMLRRFV